MFFCKTTSMNRKCVISVPPPPPPCMLATYIPSASITTKQCQQIDFDHTQIRHSSAKKTRWNAHNVLQNYSWSFTKWNLRLLSARNIDKGQNGSCKSFIFQTMLAKYQRYDTTLKNDTIRNNCIADKPLPHPMISTKRLERRVRKIPFYIRFPLLFCNVTQWRHDQCASVAWGFSHAAGKLRYLEPFCSGMPWCRCL